MSREARHPPERLARVAAAIRQELDRVARVVAEAERGAVAFRSVSPSLLELRGLGDVIHDFYTGIERIFEKVAPELNGGVPAGPAWHRELLDNMTLDLPGVRPALVSAETARVLEEFLRFRHLFRNLYGFEIEWSRLRPLLERVGPAWNAFATDATRFLEFLDAASG